MAFHFIEKDTRGFMPEKSEKGKMEDGHEPNKMVIADLPRIDARNYDPILESAETTKLEVPAQKVVMAAKNGSGSLETPRPLPVSYVKKVPTKEKNVKIAPKDQATVRLVREQCQRLCLTLFSRKQDSIRSLGFTSSIGGEGKSFLALTTARLLARDSLESVTLVECNWEHPILHEHFGIPPTPGLAGWLRGMCNEQDIRYRVDDNLTIIPAGDGQQDAVKLLRRIQQRSMWKKLERANDLLVIDLPPVITSSYGSLAAELVDTVVMVVRSEVVPAAVLAEACARLKDASLHGIVSNQEHSRIPRWLRQLL